MQNSKSLNMEKLSLAKKLSTTKKLSKPTLKTEENLGKSSIDLLYLDQSVLQEEFASSTLLLQQSREENNSFRVKHDQRRRKYVRQLDAAQTKITRTYFEDEVIRPMLEYSLYETSQNEFHDQIKSQNIIMEQNRKNRDEKISQLNSAETERSSIFTAEEKNRELNWVVKADIESQIERKCVLQQACKSATTYETTSIVRQFIDKLLDTVDWVIACKDIGKFESSSQKEYSNDIPFDIIPPLIWNDSKELLISNGFKAAPLNELKNIFPSSLLFPFNVSERPGISDINWMFKSGLFKASFIYDSQNSEIPSSADYLIKQDYSKYLETLLFKAESDLLPDQQNLPYNIPENLCLPLEKDAVLTPSWLFQTNPRYLLGQAVVEIRSAVNPIPTEPEPFVNTKHITLRGALTGMNDNLRKVFLDYITSYIPKLEIISLEEKISILLEYYRSSHFEVESEFGQLSNQVNFELTSGPGLSDNTYAKIIVYFIKQIPTPNNGFLLVDFPTTREQLLSLLYEISGVRYDNHRPQASDYASNITLNKGSLESSYNATNCGLDFVLYYDNSKVSSKGILDETETIVEPTIQDRMSARINLFNQEIVRFDESYPDSLNYLQKVYRPGRPFHSTGIEVQMTDRYLKDLKGLTDELSLTQTINYSPETLDQETIHKKIEELANSYIPTEQLDPNFWALLEEKRKQEEEEALLLAKQAEEATNIEVISPEVAQPLSEEPILPGPENEITPNEPAVNQTSPEVVPAEGEAAPPQTLASILASIPSAPPENLPPTRCENTLPLKLAKLLYEWYDCNEKHHQEMSFSFFSTLRDIKFQLLQRRRLYVDIISIKSVQLSDEIQTLFSQFHSDFNQFPEDLRYDPEGINELYLRYFQLQNKLHLLYEKKFNTTKDMIQNEFKFDNIVSILIYQLRCSGIYYLQELLNSFYSNIMVIFDYTKSIQGFLLCQQLFNNLESLLPLTPIEPNFMDYKHPSVAHLFPLPTNGKESKDKKDKEKDKKKDKDVKVTFTPYREALPPFLVNGSGMLANIPKLKIPNFSAKPVEVEEPDKGKGGKSGKKDTGKKTQVEDENIINRPDVYSDQEKVVIEEINKWKQGVFKLSRELYNNKEEELCVNVENAIWFEAEKCLMGIELAKTRLNELISWMESSEENLIDLLQRLAEERYQRELAAAERLFENVDEAIRFARPLEMLWIVTTDAPPVFPLSIWEKQSNFTIEKVNNPIEEKRPFPDQSTQIKENIPLQTDNQSSSTEKELNDFLNERRKQREILFQAWGLSQSASEIVAKYDLKQSEEYLWDDHRLGRHHLPSSPNKPIQATPLEERI